MLIWLSLTTPSGQTLSVSSSEPTSTDGPAVLKNSPPGFYCSVVWRTVTAQGACGLDMGTASSESSHGLAQRDVSTPSRRQLGMPSVMTGHSLPVEEVEDADPRDQLHFAQLP